MNESDEKLVKELADKCMTNRALLKPALREAIRITRKRTLETAARTCDALQVFGPVVLDNDPVEAANRATSAIATKLRRMSEESKEGMSGQGKPTIPEVMPLVVELYKRSSAGCCLHIVLDDGNVSDGDAEFCVEWARNKGHEECVKLAELLLEMSRTQRRKIYQSHRHF